LKPALQTFKNQVRKMKNPVLFIVLAALIALSSISCEEEQNICNPPSGPHLINPPYPPAGPTDGYKFEQYTFTASGGLCSHGHSITLYRFDWGDSSFSDWGEASQAHEYDSTIVYQIRTVCQCSEGLISDWSAPIEFTIWHQDTLYASSDAYISDMNPGSNYGGSDTLIVGLMGGRFWTALNFPFNTFLPDIQIYDASLHLRAISSGAGTPFEVRVGMLTTEWEENLVNWNQYIDGWYFAYHTLWISGAAGWMELNCEMEISEMFNQGWDEGLLLFTSYDITTTHYQFFGSRESGNAPYLVLSWRPGEGLVSGGKEGGALKPVELK